MISYRNSSPFKSVECGICLSSKDETAVENSLLSYPITMPCCKGNVHLLCLKTWFQEKISCPFCRKEDEFSRAGKLLCMKKLYENQQNLTPNDNQLIYDFDKIIPNRDTVIHIKDHRGANFNSSLCISYQTIGLIFTVGLGIIFLSTLIFPLYPS